MTKKMTKAQKIEEAKACVESIKDQILRAKKDKAGKVKILEEDVIERLERLIKMWAGHEGYEEAATRMRLWIGNTDRIYLPGLSKQVVTPCLELCEALKTGYKALSSVQEAPAWLDGIELNKCKVSGEYETELVFASCAHDIISVVREATDRLQSFIKECDEGISSMDNELLAAMERVAQLENE